MENIDDKHKMKATICKTTTDKDNMDEIVPIPLEVNVLINNESRTDKDDNEDLEDDNNLPKPRWN